MICMLGVVTNYCVGASKRRAEIITPTMAALANRDPISAAAPHFDAH